MRCERVWASNGVHVILPTEVVNAVIIDKCALSTKTRVPDDLKPIVRNILSSEPAEPDDEVKAELKRIADRIRDKVRRYYQCSAYIMEARCSNAFAELQITRRLKKA